MRAAMALLPLFPAPDLPEPPAGMETASSASQVSTRTATQAAGPDVTPPAAAAAIQPISAARAAGLQQLAHLWRADEVAHAAGREVAVASGFAALDAELPGGGWPQGQLTELLLDAPGIGELSLLAPVLTRCAQDARACVWVLPCERAATGALPVLPYPPALAAAGIDLARALFVQPETPREAFWAIEQSLRAAHLGALVSWLPQSPSSPRESEFRALRRLQLLAGRKPAPVFLLRDTRALQAPSPAALRLQLAARDGELSITILKRRGRPLLEPVTLQVHPEHWHRAQVDSPTTGANAARPQPVGMLQQVALVAQRWSAKAIFSH
jgi:cell division inhibitor SulA/protein ImuA